MEEPTRYPLNAPGDFYVEDQACISCGVPEMEAPDLMSNCEGHCYFKKQPTTPEELEQAVFAVAVSCCDSVRYGGKDIAILAAIEKLEGRPGFVPLVSLPRPEAREYQPKAVHRAPPIRRLVRREGPNPDRQRRR